LEHVNPVICTIDDLLICFENAGDACIVELAEALTRFKRYSEDDVFFLGLAGSKFLQQIING
jgi:hypothetical protein